MVALLALTPVAGRLADRIGYKVVLLGSLLGLACTVYPLFHWIDGGSLVAVSVGMGIFAVLMAGPEATLAVAMANLFPPRLRYSGTAVGYNLTLALFGGTAPMFATWLITRTKDLTAPAIYLTIVAIISFAVTLTIESHHASKP